MTATYKRSSNTRALSDRRHRLLQPMSHVLSVTLRLQLFGNVNLQLRCLYKSFLRNLVTFGTGLTKSCGRLASIVRQTVLSICNHHWLPL